MLTEHTHTRSASGGCKHWKGSASPQFAQESPSFSSSLVAAERLCILIDPWICTCGPSMCWPRWTLANRAVHSHPQAPAHAAAGYSQEESLDSSDVLCILGLTLNTETSHQVHKTVRGLQSKCTWMSKQWVNVSAKWSDNKCDDIIESVCENAKHCLEPYSQRWWLVAVLCFILMLQTVGGMEKAISCLFWFWDLLTGIFTVLSQSYLVLLSRFFLFSTS